MDKQQFEHYVKERYTDQVNWYDRKSLWNQGWYKRLQWYLIVLSAITPILIATQEHLGETAKWLPLLSAALVAIFTTAMKTFNYQENWLNYRATCEALKKEKFLYEARIGDYAHVSDSESLFVERVENLISSENTVWLASHKPQEEQAEADS